MIVGVDDSDDRFVVTSVTGWGIAWETPFERIGASGRPPTSFYVLDRFDGYRVVGDFTAPAEGGYGGDVWRWMKAVLLAIELNAWSETDGWQDVEPMEVIA